MGDVRIEGTNCGWKISGGGGGGGGGGGRTNCGGGGGGGAGTRISLSACIELPVDDHEAKVRDTATRRLHSMGMNV